MEAVKGLLHAGSAPEGVVQAHAGAVSSLSLSEDGWVLASAGRDSIVSLWDLRTHARLNSIPVLEPLEGAVFLPAPSGPGRPSKKARTSGASNAALAGLRIGTAGSTGLLKVCLGHPLQHTLLSRPPAIVLNFYTTFQTHSTGI